MKLSINQLNQLTKLNHLRRPHIFIPLISIVFSLISILLIVAQLEHSQIIKSFAQVTPPATKIMVVGDSISHGSAGDWTWRYRLWQHLASSSASVEFVGPFNGVYDPTTQDFHSQGYIEDDFDRDHNATAGRFTRDEKNTIAGYVTTYMPNAPNTTNILLINLGTNDLAWPDSNGLYKTGQQVAVEMYTLISNARAANPNIKIVLSKITPNGNADESYTARWTEYNNWLTLFAQPPTSTQTSPIVLADPVTGFDTAVDTFDRLHPSPSGEYKIAAAFANALASGFGIGTAYGPIPQAPPWPIAPTNVTAVPIYNAVKLNWEKAQGANEYYIHYRNVNSGPSFTRLPSHVTGTSFTQSSLVNGQTYEFAVSTKRGFYEGPQSPVAQATLPEAKGSITTLPPARILDTRTSVGGHQAVMTPGETMNLQILGVEGVPSSAVSAVIVNVAVVPGTSAGFLTLYPSGNTRPLASTINYTPGIIIANQALVPVGANGKISIFNSAGNNHVIVDLQGWIGTDSTPADGKVSSFYPVRVLDTRTTVGGHLGTLNGGQIMTISPLVELNNQGVDTTNVKAIIANIAGVPSPTTRGYLTAYPYGTSLPNAATVSVETAGVIISNLALIPVGTDGKINIFNSSGSMHIVVDVQAVVIEGNAVGLQTVQPARILDTRTTNGGQNYTPIGPNNSINLRVLGVGGIPASGVSAVVLHMTAVLPTTNGFLTAYPKGTTRPLASTLNYTTGRIISNNVLVPVGADGSISIYNSSGNTHVVIDAQGWVASSP